MVMLSVALPRSLARILGLCLSPFLPLAGGGGERDMSFCSDGRIDATEGGREAASLAVAPRHL